MDRRIRLAERRGLLSGRRLSPVQTAALNLLILREQREKAEEWERQVKLAFLTAPADSNLRTNTDFVRLMFPDWFPPRDIDEVPEGFTGEIVYEEEEQLTAEEAERILAQMISDGGGVFASSDMEDW